jgi:hypothetical protein
MGAFEGSKRSSSNVFDRGLGDEESIELGSSPFILIRSILGDTSSLAWGMEDARMSRGKNRDRE